MNISKTKHHVEKIRNLIDPNRHGGVSGYELRPAVELLDNMESLLLQAYTCMADAACTPDDFEADYFRQRAGSLIARLLDEKDTAAIAAVSDL